jgi:hypothetical protein
MSLIYAFVARGRTVLAEHSAIAGNFRTVAVECLQNSSITDDKFTVTADAYTFNYLVHSGYSESGTGCVRLFRAHVHGSCRHLRTRSRWHACPACEQQQRQAGVCCTACCRTSSCTRTHHMLPTDLVRAAPPATHTPTHSVPGGGGRGVRPADTFCVPGAAAGRVYGEVC